MQSLYGLDARAFAAAGNYNAVTVRPLAEADRTDWDRLWKGYLDFYETTLPPAQYDLTFKRFLDPAEPMFAYLAMHDGKAKGLVHIILHRHGWRDGPTCYLQDLYVDLDTRGTRMGRALIEHVYRVTKAAGGGRVYWLTHETNTTARQLYDRIADKTGFIQYAKTL
ncbi:MAG: GNAT family N-acetyltransferase [Alphaproteobacteria bacterium]|nr:GNAT family N-acetyltransferase [Alphaproteobacteria bacterium]